VPRWASLLPALAEHGVPVGGAASPVRVGGGDFSAAWRVDGREDRLFLKTGPAEAGDMFAAEADGLREIAATGTLRVPEVHATLVHDGVAVIALEWLDLGAPGAGTQERLGAGLAAMHRVTAREHGWYRDNTIGATPQINARSTGWCEFYREYRLRFQLDLAARQGYSGRLQELGGRLLEHLDELFDGHRPDASLLHGDLWCGNQGACGDQPVVFDPAVYYGDRETDIAMTRLFGGFSGRFYEAYVHAWPLPPGHEIRRDLYQLYHVLNHLNLFGRSYLGRAEALIRSALSAA